MSENKLDLSEYENIDLDDLETTEQKCKYLITHGVLELDPDEELELLNAHEFDERTELYINYVFETLIEHINQGQEDFPPFIYGKYSDK